MSPVRLSVLECGDKVEGASWEEAYRKLVGELLGKNSVQVLWSLLQRMLHAWLWVGEDSSRHKACLFGLSAKAVAFPSIKQRPESSTRGAPTGGTLLEIKANYCIVRVTIYMYRHLLCSNLL